MSKYRGKYKKSRTCEHAVEVYMVMASVKDTCPKKIKYSSGYMVDKYLCETCEYWQEKKNG